MHSLMNSVSNSLIASFQLMNFKRLSKKLTIIKGMMSDLVNLHQEVIKSIYKITQMLICLTLVCQIIYLYLLIEQEINDLNGVMQ